MMRTDYATLRALGYRALSAFRCSRAMDAFREHEDDTIRFRYEPDQDPDLSFLDQDCYQGSREGRACADAIRRMAEDDGVWVAFIETRCPECTQWTIRDCLGGLIGSPGLSLGDDGNALPLECAADMVNEALRALSASHASHPH